MKAIILVGLGGGVGSIFRYLTSVWLNKYVHGSFPFATFMANVLGCLVIGLLIGLFQRSQVFSQDLRLLLIPGFCGGYTTFSAFAAENVSLIQYNQPFMALSYVVLSVLAGLLAVWLGLVIAGA